jgi:hypothetical protein
MTVKIGVDPTKIPLGYSNGVLKVGSPTGAATEAMVTVNVNVTPLLGVTQLFPHIADGNEWQTDFLLINPTPSAVTVQMKFHLDNGVPTLPIIGLGPVAGISNITIPPLGSALYRTAGFSNGAIVSGWVEVTSAMPINGQALFRRHASDGKYYEGSVPLATPSQSFTLPFDGGTYPGNGAAPITTFYTGLALANPDASTSATVACSAYDPNGAVLGNFQAVSVPALAHMAAELQATPPYMSVIGTGRGILVCNSNVAVGVLGLRFFGIDALSSLPVITGN